MRTWPQQLDPRTVPIIGVDDSLPAVAPDRLEPSALRARFANPPIWQPEQLSDRFRTHADAPRAAAVLVPIIAHPTPTVLLTQRAAQLRSHAGQVAFPGGRIEESDHGPAAAALREAYEEVGLEPSRVELIGRLPEYLTGTGYRVTPVVGLIGSGFVPRPDPSEVADVFEVPLDFLMNPRHHQRRFVQLEDRERRFFAMPYRPPALDTDYFIWGATAAMLRNLYRLLSA
ncbi:MAG: coenzyme A pyrophosphatase [Lautropia sp. SCN 66-9]|nr:MAG: coenzyme A pyrophosphatase [Lautropia sp. SCN 66-9]